MYNIKDIYEIKSPIILKKIGGKEVGQIPTFWVKGISQNIGEIGQIEISVPKFVQDSITKEDIKNPIYDEFINERLIQVEDNIYVLKVLKGKNKKTKEIIGKTLEIKLQKNDLELEDVGLQLKGTPVIDEIKSLDDILYEETGWHVTYVNPSILYDNIEEEVFKIRWQETVSMKWYDFLRDTLAEQFDCLVIFDNVNKGVKFILEDELGGDPQIVLSEDNYIKSIQITQDSNELTTRLKIKGNEDMDIIGSLSTGEPYLEDYTYFMENGEMSDELTLALTQYYEITEQRQTQWKILNDERQVKESEKQDKGYDFSIKNTQLRVKTELLDRLTIFDDGEDYGELIGEISQLEDDINLLETQIQVLDTDIANLQTAIDDIVLLSKKKTATGSNGTLIFNQDLLDELKQFYFTKIYINDSFLTDNVGDLINLAKRILRDSSYPTYSWEMDSINFFKRTNYLDQFDKGWQGNLSLGDLIILYDREENKEQLIYVVGYNLTQTDLKFTFSNKKTWKPNGTTLSDYLLRAKNAMRTLESKRYLFIQQKYNRLNIPSEFVPKEKIKPIHGSDGENEDDVII